MNYFSSALSSPIGTNFPVVTSQLVRMQLEKMFSDYETFSRMHGTKRLDIKFSDEMGFLSHVPEASSVFFARISKIDLTEYKAWYAFNIELIAFLLGFIQEIDICVEKLSFPVKILGCTYAENICVKGRNGWVKISGSQANEAMYQSVEVSGFGIRWIDACANTSFFDHSGTIPFLISDPTFLVSDPLDNNPNISDIRSSENSIFSKQIIGALQFLQEVSEEYFLWVIYNCREFGPLMKPSNPGTTSRTSLVYPGHVSINNHASLIEVLNMLVHECSHLYFHLLHFSFPICERNAPDCYSILKNTKRPLVNVLLGFHAFSNVLILLKSLNKGEGSQVCEQELSFNIGHVEKYVASLDKELDAHKHYLLQDSGRIIYEHLRMRLKDSQSLCLA